MANTVTIVIDGDTVKAVSAINAVETMLDHLDKKTRKTSENSSDSFGLIDQALSKIGINLGALTVGFAVGSVVAGLGAMMKSAIDTADNLAKLSQRTGMTVESLSTMSYALSLNDMSVEGFTTSVKKLSESMNGISEDGEKTSNVLVKIGVEATDQSGKLRSVDAVLLDVADKFKTMPDGAQKAAMAVDLFGKAGMDMIPFLNNGSEGIKQLQDEAKKLGLEIDTTTAKMAEQFNDQLETLGRQASSLGMTMASELLPGLISVTGGLIDFMAESGAASVVGQTFSYAIKGIATALVFFVEGITTGVTLLGTFGAAIAKIVTGDWDEIDDVLSIGFQKMKQSALDAGDTLAKIWGNAPASNLTNELDNVNAGLNTVGSTAKKTEKSFADLYAEMQNKINKIALPQMYQKVQEAGKEFEKLFDTAKNPAERVQAALAYKDYVFYLTGIQDTVKNTRKVIDEALFSEYKNPMPQITEQFANVQLPNEPLQQYRDNTLLTYEEMANGAVTTFGVMSEAALQYYQQGGERSKTMLALYKATAITQTAITTVQAAMAALEPPPIGLGPIFGIPLMGATIALGIANISRIASMQVGSGLAGGGAVSVPTITRENNNNTTTNNTRSQAVTINVYGNIVDQDQFAREIIPAIQKAYGDGA